MKDKTLSLSYMYEVEMKFRLSDPSAFAEHLKSLGCELGPMIEEADQFYQHPLRDFTLTDECLRVRRHRLPGGKEVKYLTYKGPKLDQETKTRREIEIQIDSTEPWEEILDVLGFQGKAAIRKFRRQGELQISGQSIGICLDSLPELGGQSFVELEILATESDWEVKRDFVIEVSKQFGLGESVRTSYLGLLMQTNLQSD